MLPKWLAPSTPFSWDQMRDARCKCKIDNSELSTQSSVELVSAAIFGSSRQDVTAIFDPSSLAFKPSPACVALHLLLFYLY